MVEAYKNNSFRLDINGLRAYAVLFVLLFHFKIYGFDAGFIGVDIFFVISGFLMTGIIASGIERKNFDIFKFYLARIRRILPVLVALISFLLLTGWFLLPSVEYRSLGEESISALTFLSNIFFWRSSGYFNADAHEKWLLHTWTLGVEFQFYILLPIYLLILSKLKAGTKTLFYGLVAAFVLSLCLSIALTDKTPTAAFYLLPTRAWEFFAGGVVCILVKKYPKILSLGKAIFFTGTILLTSSIFIINNKIPWPSAWALLPVVGTALIILSQQEKSFLTANPVAQWIGTRSYSIYIWHWPIVVALNFLGAQDNYIYIIIGIFLSIILGHISYHVIESPTRDFLSKILPMKQFAITAAILILVGGVALSIKSFTFKDRMPQAVELAANEQKNDDPRLEKCESGLKTIASPSCAYGNKNNISAIVIGDSHAQATVTSVEKAALKYEKGLIAWTLAGCPTIDNVKFTNTSQSLENSCNSFNKWKDRELLKYPKLPIIIINRTSTYVMGPNEPNRKDEAKTPSIYFTKKYEDINNAEFQQEFSRNLTDTACRLAKDRKVYLVRPIPEFGLKVPQSISHNLIIKGTSEESKLSINEYYKRHQIVLNAQNKAAAECGVKILNPLPYLCDDKYCYGSIKGRPLYQDDDHLSEFGNKFITPIFENIFSRQIPS